MLKKEKKKQRKFEEIEIPFKKEEKKKPETHVRFKKNDDYVVLEPLDIWNQKKTSIEQKPIVSKEVIEIKRKTPKEKKVVEKKIHKKKEEKKEEEKPKLIIKKTQPKQIELKSTVKKILPKPPEKIIKPEEPISKIPINLIETDIDKLMRIIDEKKIVDLEYLSKTLKINVERLEAWAKMLEDRGLIEIEYPILGLPKLRKKKWKKKS